MRRAKKQAVKQVFGHDHDDGPLLIVSSRLIWKKGMGLLQDRMEHLVACAGGLALTLICRIHFHRQFSLGHAAARPMPTFISVY
jgi:starch synthase